MRVAASFFDKHRYIWRNRAFLLSTVIGVLLFFSSLVVNYYTVSYASHVEGGPTTDILLSNLPVINTDIVFSEGAYLFIVLVTLLLIWEPKAIPFVLKSLTLFVLVRCCFVVMTHLSPYPDYINTDLSKYFSSGADLFFSGHTGIPFFLALIFWENKYLRWFFLFSSILAAIAVILGHLHYTIDIFSAYFIAFGIYHFALRLFPKDYQLFQHGLDATHIAEPVD